nr:MAG TPA: hypothetical protein [Caudoviricetes sp.]
MYISLKKSKNKFIFHHLFNQAVYSCKTIGIDFKDL